MCCRLRTCPCASTARGRLYARQYCETTSRRFISELWSTAVTSAARCWSALRHYELTRNTCIRKTSNELVMAAVASSHERLLCLTISPASTHICCLTSTVVDWTSFPANSVIWPLRRTARWSAISKSVIVMHRSTGVQFARAFFVVVATFSGIFVYITPVPLRALLPAAQQRSWTAGMRTVRSIWRILAACSALLSCDCGNCVYDTVCTCDSVGI